MSSRAINYRISYTPVYMRGAISPLGAWQNEEEIKAEDVEEGDAPKRRRCIPNPNGTLMRILTVFVYLFSMSTMAIALSVYYIYIYVPAPLIHVKDDLRFCCCPMPGTGVGEKLAALEHVGGRSKPQHLYQVGQLAYPKQQLTYINQLDTTSENCTEPYAPIITD